MFNNKIKAINPVEYAKGIVANEKIRFDDFNGEKKYFSKYLPVDGDIQVGDSILDPNNNVYKCTRIDNIYLNCSGYNGLVRISRCKKVKLFLCSRDIQVGDTLIKNGIEYLAHSRPDGVPFIGYYNKDWCYLDNDCFKVLGEISPEATWVKEGDEFEEDDWQFVIYDMDERTILSKFPIPKFANLEIKGPCEHFH